MIPTLHCTLFRNESNSQYVEGINLSIDISILGVGILGVVGSLGTDFLNAKNYSSSEVVRLFNGGWLFILFLLCVVVQEKYPDFSFPVSQTDGNMIPYYSYCTWSSHANVSSPHD